jgi:hypothetical protein
MKERPTKKKPERASTGRFSIDARIGHVQKDDSRTESIASNETVSSSFVGAFSRFDLSATKTIKKNLSKITVLQIVGNVVNTVTHKIGQRLKSSFTDGQLDEETLAEALAEDNIDLVLSREEQEDLIMDIVGPKVKIHPETIADDVGQGQSIKNFIWLD